MLKKGKKSKTLNKLKSESGCSLLSCHFMALLVSLAEQPGMEVNEMFVRALPGALGRDQRISAVSKKIFSF